MRVVHPPAGGKAHEIERDLHILENSLSWLYTWPQRGKKREKPKKYGAYAPQMHHIRPQATPGATPHPPFPLSITAGEGKRRARKLRGSFTKAEARHKCTDRQFRKVLGCSTI